MGGTLGARALRPNRCNRPYALPIGVYGLRASCQDGEIVPELPDITVYVEALETRILNQRLERVRVVGPFLLRTATPPLHAAEGESVRELRRVGKRIAIGLQNNLWLVLHLMIAGRLHWSKVGVKLSPKRALAALDFPHGSLLLTEAGSQRRASLHVVQGEEGLRDLDPGGLEVLTADFASFGVRLTSGNHTLKRALTDPRLFSGIGNAYSDEILHRAQLSPVTLTGRLESNEIERLHYATRSVLPRVDRPAACGSSRTVPGKCNGVSRGNGRPWKIW